MDTERAESIGARRHAIERSCEHLYAERDALDKQIAELDEEGTRLWTELRAILGDDEEG